MQSKDLNGNWTLTQADTGEQFTATVPGCVHTDLLAAGKIKDPFYRDRELDLQWIGKTDWVYARTFKVPASFLKYDRAILQCEGLDTFSTVKINGNTAGTTDNMFRRWEFDVSDLLVAGENRIEVRFRSTYPYMKREQAKRFLTHTGIGHHRIEGSNRVRKCQCHYGWDWGPMLVPVGIWRPICLTIYDTGRITNLYIAQSHGRSLVELTVTSSMATWRRQPTELQVTVSHGGHEVVGKKVRPEGKSAFVKLRIDNPKLWWPNGMGDQPLYEVKATLLDTKGKTLDQAVRTIGLRTLRLERKPDRWGESFHFVVNDRPFFSKGANWIPADSFTTRITAEQYEDLIDSTVQANMNMLRVWGGGIYEEDLFYDLCDRKGICIWQDFMFACSAYPSFDSEWMRTVKEEVRDNVRRLRHHPCIALWCGNNEIEQIGGLIGKPEEGSMTWPEYKKLFDRVIPQILEAEDPQRDYWPSSEHSPHGDRTDSNNPRWGDSHLWDVWHERKPFEWYRTCEHRFNSEFGFQSFPEPLTTYAYTEPEDRNITSYVMELHQRSKIGNSTIIDYMLSWFRLPVGFENTLWLSQILQGLAIKYAVEHWRRRKPQGMGTLYWQLNDCWPVTSCASVDYYHRWKALHYMARCFFNPLLVSAVEDAEKRTCELWVTSDLAKDLEGEICWKLTDLAGRALLTGIVPARIAADRSRRITTLKFMEAVAGAGERSVLLWMELLVDGKRVSNNMASFVRPKHMDLTDPGFTTRVKARKDGRFAVTIRSRRPALWVWPEVKNVDAGYSDRFFHLSGGESRQVNIAPCKSLTEAQFVKHLVVRSLRDTYNE